MRRIGKITLWILGAWAGLMLLTGLGMKALLSGDQLDSLLSMIGTRLPVRVTTGGGDFDLAEWFRLRPAVRVADIEVANPPGFSGEPMLHAREASIQLHLLSLLGDEIHVSDFSLREPVMTVERNRRGRTNVEALLRLLEKQRQATPRAPAEGQPAGAGSKGRHLAVDSFSIDGGSIRYTGPGSPSITAHDIQLKLTGFSEDRSCDVRFLSKLFGSPDSVVSFQGRAGPFGGKSLPAAGDFQVNLAPGQIPEALRTEYLGDLLRVPGKGSRAHFEASMKGDLLGVFRGTGKLSLSGVRLGADTAHQMELAGQAPLQMTLRRILTRPSFQIVVKKGALSLGEGRWKGDVTAIYNGKKFLGASTGSIAGVEINQLLATFFSTSDAVFGRGEIPSYTLRFSGSNAAQIRNSLAGEGRISLGEGHIALFDLIDSINRQANKLLSPKPVAAGATNFLRFQTGFEIRNGHVIFPDPLLESAASEITGKGYVTFDKQLHFDLTAKVRGELARLLQSVSGSPGGAEVSVPLTIRGTLDDPVVRPDTARLAVGGALGILDRLLGGGGASEKKPPPAPKQ